MKTVVSVLLSTALSVVATRYWPQIAEWTGPAARAVVETVSNPGPHGAWYASRSLGVVSYVLIWSSLVGGLLMSSAWFDGLIGRGRLLAFHQSTAIIGVLLGLAHALVLIPDGWTKFGLYDLFVPFGSYYEPLLSGIGTLSLYLSFVVSVSFWFRKRMGMKAWRYLHYSSVLAYAGALWHGFQIGTDSYEPWLLLTYFATSIFIVFGLVVRITYIRPQIKRRAMATAATS